MRVLRVLPELDFGGVESRLQVQARLHDRSAYELLACCFHRPGKALEVVRSAGVPVSVLGVRPSPRNPAATLELARHIRRVRPDVIHASIAEANFHSLLAGFMTNVPVRIAEETGMPRHKRLARLAFRALYASANAVVGVTRAVCDYSIEADGAPRDRVRLIYNCADPRYFPSQRLSPARRPAPYEVLLVGRLVPVKNHVFFLRALKPVLNELPIHVKLAGDGPLRAELEHEIATLGLASKVTLLGARSDVQELLATAQLFALPSVSEGCSVSLIEAMAAGTHVVGSDVAGIREVMGALANDWTAPADSATAWAELIRCAYSLSPGRRAELGALAQQRAYEAFSPQAYVAALQQMYHELCARRS